MITIRFLIPYFGQWPFWMPYFVTSCRQNPDIHWLLFTDCGAIPDCPPNIECRPMTYSAYCALVGNRLEIDFSPPSPYKLCDIKPALGSIHAEDIAGYDFWAFGDIDVVYGQLREYFTNERLKRYHLLSTHRNRISGHLCLIRNEDRWNQAFRHIPRWKAYLSDTSHHAFDEGPFSRLFIRHKNWPSSLRRIHDFFNPWRRHADFTEAFSTPYGRIPWIDGTMNFPEQWNWNAGVLTSERDGNHQFPYLHFIGMKDCWKHSITQKAVDSWEVSSHFRIDAFGIFQELP